MRAADRRMLLVPSTSITNPTTMGMMHAHCDVNAGCKCVSHVVRALGGASTSVWNDVAAAASYCVVLVFVVVDRNVY